MRCGLTWCGYQVILLLQKEKKEKKQKKQSKQKNRLISNSVKNLISSKKSTNLAHHEETNSFAWELIGYSASHKTLSYRMTISHTLQ